jgi:hypothetical protein
LLEKQYIAGQLLSLLLAQKRFEMQECAPQDCQLQRRTPQGSSTRLHAIFDCTETRLAQLA